MIISNFKRSSIKFNYNNKKFSLFQIYEKNLNSKSKRMGQICHGFQYPSHSNEKKKKLPIEPTSLVAPDEPEPTPYEFLPKKPVLPVMPDFSGEKHFKIVLVGDTTVGKTCLITIFISGAFVETYKPTVLDVYEGPKVIRKHTREQTIEKQVKIELHDTGGDEHLGVNRKY